MLVGVLLSLFVLLVVLTPWAFVDAHAHARKERVAWRVLLLVTWPVGALLYGVARPRRGALRIATLLVLGSQGALLWVGSRNVAPDSRAPATLGLYDAVGDTDRLRLASVFGSRGGLGNDDYVSRLSLSEDGTSVLVSGGLSLRLWDVPSRSVRRTLEALPDNDILAGWMYGRWLGRGKVAALSADGRTLAAERGGVTLRAGAPILAFSYDAIAGNAHLVDVWSPNGSHFRLRAHDGNITMLAFVADRLWSASYDGSLAEWDPAEGRLLRRIQTHRGWIQAAALSADGGLALVSAWQPYGDSGPAGHLGLWDLSNGELRFELSGHDDRAHAVGFIEGAGQAVSASFDGFRMWDVQTGAELRFVRSDQPLTRVTFSADGRFAATGSPNVDLWDLAEGEVVDRILLEGAQDEPASVAFATDGSFVLGTRRGAVLEFDWKD